MGIEVVLRFRQSPGWGETAENYQVDVVRAPGRGWGGPATAEGLDEHQVQALYALLRDYLQRYQEGALHSPGWQETEPLRATGNQLFCALPETVQQRLHEALRLGREQGQGVDLTLVFDPSARTLLRLPWELLHSPEQRLFFALQGGGVTRRLSLPAVPRLPAGYQPRAILGVWAEPDGVGALAERSAYAPAPGLGEGVFWLQGAESLKQMAFAFEGGGYDALHLVAHGRAGESWESFAVALEGNLQGKEKKGSSRGQIEWISADHLATFLAGYPSLRLVYLDVCAGGEVDGSPFAPAGLATELIQNGVAAVVVMQHEIGQAASGVVAYHFYEALAEGDSVAGALTRGRRALRGLVGDPVQWSVPALYGQQQVVPAPGDSSPAADWVLERVSPAAIHDLLLVIAALWLTAYLSRQFTQLRTGAWRELAALMLGSTLLPLLGALLMRKGIGRLAEKHRPDRRGWLLLWRRKYEAALVWAFTVWALIWLVAGAIFWSGVELAPGWRHGGWTLALVGLVAAGYVGARQGIRQVHLFWKNGREPFRWSGWFLLLMAPLLPLVYLLPMWLVLRLSAWAGIVVYGVVVLLTALAAVVEQEGG